MFSRVDMASEISALRLQLSRFEAENEDIKRERDQFRAQLAQFRQENVTLESRVQDLETQNNDLKRNLSRTQVSFFTLLSLLSFQL